MPKGAEVAVSSWRVGGYRRGVISPSTLLLFSVAGLALVVVPGPNHLYITARGIAQGRAAAIASAVGVETGTLVHIAAAAAGLSYVIAQSAAAFTAVKWAGAAYLSTSASVR
jgi:threonine/homoserine/homoserine lactone efflux protein